MVCVYEIIYRGFIRGLYLATLMLLLGDDVHGHIKRAVPLRRRTGRSAWVGDSSWRSRRCTTKIKIYRFLLCYPFWHSSSPRPGDVKRHRGRLSRVDVIHPRRSGVWDLWVGGREGDKDKG